MGSPAPTPVTADKAAFTFYDIESLANAFTLCTYSQKKNIVHVFYLIDDDGSEVAQVNSFAEPASLRESLTRPAQVIIDNNPAFDATLGDIQFHNLRNWEANLLLAKIVGLSDADSVNNPSASSTFDVLGTRPVCDTDPNYDPFDKHPYLAGYNSNNYDTVILAMYLSRAFAHVRNCIDQGLPPESGFIPASAADIRNHNDQLFTEQYRSYMPRYLVDQDGGWNSTANKIRTAMIHSGRHIDVARFNEVQQRVALKRLLGGLGRQIMESEKLGSHNARLNTLEEFFELLAYNVSDVVGLAKLFEHPTYSSGFDLKKGLLDEYPETIYMQHKGTSQPNISPYSVRRNRLTPDSSSAKFAAYILAPYKALKDWETVSFLYPEKSVAEARGVEQVNVLEESRKFFYENIEDAAARAQFDEVYRYYKSIEGQNFNDSEDYRDHFATLHRELTMAQRAQWLRDQGIDPDQATEDQRDQAAQMFPIKGALPSKSLKDIPKRPNNIPYFFRDGTPSRAFATFSTGGIHGAEADWDAWEADAAEAKAYNQRLDEAQEAFPNPLDLWAAKEFVASDGTVVPRKELLTAKTRLRDLQTMAEELEGVTDPSERQRIIEEKYEGVGYREHKKLPALFESKPDGSNKLKGKYTFTSAEPAIHEDFTSYYPNLLRGMNAFYNPELGQDRYTKIFFDKERYGKQMKDPSISAEEKDRLSVLRNGTKLILNAASGAGDASHDNNIRMNNVIISMRILGQLFSWRIGQAQTLAGAKIISTNTDGLYSAQLDHETNDRILEEQAAATGVEIEPEPMIVVSKDSNNRLELDTPAEGEPVWEAKIITGSGGSLACHKEPRPDKSLAHPAVLDWALARYLRYIVGGYQPAHRETPLSMDEPLDRTVGHELMRQAVRDNPPVLAARLFQQIVAASSGSLTFPFASDPVEPEDPDQISNPRPLQHYNRCFFVHKNKPGAVSLRAAGAWTVNPASALKRKRDGEQAVQDDEVAMEILRANGYTRRHAEAAGGMTLLPADQDTAVRKVAGVDPSWDVIIDNSDLIEKPDDQLMQLLGCLDYEVYVEKLAEKFDDNWRNTRTEVAEDN